jgi:hypothetical protein
VQGIRVRDSRFQTAEGVGVGSTLAEVRRHYEVMLTEEEGPQAIAPALQMTFGLGDASFAPTAKVTSVWLYGYPAAIRKARCPERGRVGTVTDGSADHALHPTRLRRSRAAAGAGERARSAVVTIETSIG